MPRRYPAEFRSQVIELVSASTILWLYTGSRSGSAAAERCAQQLVAACFGLLALYVTFDAISTLRGSGGLQRGRLQLVTDGWVGCFCPACATRDRGA